MNKHFFIWIYKTSSILKLGICVYFMTVRDPKNVLRLDGNIFFTKKWTVFLKIFSISLVTLLLRKGKNNNWHYYWKNDWEFPPVIFFQ